MTQAEAVSAMSGNTLPKTFDPSTFPSAVGIGILIADQIGEYNERDLMKIATDIANGVPHAKEAFHYVYSRMMGWER